MPPLYRWIIRTPATLFNPTKVLAWSRNRGRTTGEACYAACVPVRPCIVSFTDADGFRHSVEVQAGSLYEAVSAAVAAFREHGCALGSTALIEIEVRGPAVRHSVNMLKVREWAASAARSPKERLLKERLKGLLAS